MGSSRENMGPPQVSLAGPQPGAGGGGPAGTCWSFLLASSPLHVQTHALPSPKQMRTLGDTACGRALLAGLIKCEVVWIMKSLLGKRIR